MNDNFPSPLVGPHIDMRDCPLTIDILQRIAGPDIGDVRPVLADLERRGLLKVVDGVIKLTLLEDLPPIPDDDEEKAR